MNSKIKPYIEESSQEFEQSLTDVVSMTVGDIKRIRNEIFHMTIDAWCDNHADEKIDYRELGELSYWLQEQLTTVIVNRVFE